jgi:hypothetical protein
MIGRFTTTLITYWQIWNGIRVYTMHDLSWELTVILITVRCLQKLGKDWQEIKKAAQKAEWAGGYETVSDSFSNSFVALENLHYSEDISRAWKDITENTKISTKKSLGLHELKQHKPWVDEECLGFLDQRNQAKLQLLQYLSQCNVDNLNNVRREANRYFRNRRRNIGKLKLMNLKLTVRSEISKTCTGPLMTLREVTRLELI